MPSSESATDSKDYIAIETIALTKKFKERTSVDNLNLAVKKGELYALLGDNGAGKTTTINMLTTLLSPTSGDFRICGYRGGVDKQAIKESFGIVSQEVAIYQELTAYENLKFIADLYGIEEKESEQRIEKLLKDAGLIERANDLAGQFSGGMQRKLAIASALLHKPQVLFMDEPTVGLDPGSRRQIWQTLTQLKEEGVTVLLTTHYLEEAELLADRIGIIREGKLVVEGTIEELRYKIRGIRGIAIRLTESIGVKKVSEKIDEIKNIINTEVKLDTLRNTIYLTQPHDTELVMSLRKVLDWLEQEEISFSRFATSEPNLEEVFLAISTDSNLTSEGD